MTTEATRQLMFPHAVPAVEPDLGTVAVFNAAFATGSGTSSGMLIRTADGWSDDPNGRGARTWEQLTDLDALNARIQERHPGSTASFAAVEVKVVALPLGPTDTKES